MRREGGVHGVLRRLGDKAVRGDADRQLAEVVVHLIGGVAVESDQRLELLRPATDDGDHQWQREIGSAGHGVRRAANGDPQRQRVLHGLGEDFEARDRLGVRRAFPNHLAAPADGQQFLELFLEQRVVVVQVVAEQREAFDEGAASGHDLGAPVGEQIEGPRIAARRGWGRRSSAPSPRSRAGWSSSALRPRRGWSPAPRRRNRDDGVRPARRNRGRPGRRVRSPRAGPSGARPETAGDCR